MSDVAALDTGVPGVSSFDSVIRQYAKGMTETDAMQGELKESRRLQRGIAEKLITDKPPPPPDTAAPTPPPAPTQQKSPMESFGSMASVIGILGGFLSHAPLTASLNAATGAMQGYRQRDLETYQQNYKQWQMQSEYAEKLAEWQNNRYKQAFDAYKDNHDQLTAALGAIASADKDTLAAKALQTGDLRNFGELLNMRENALAKYRDYRLEADRMGATRSVELRAVDEMQRSPEWLAAPPAQKIKMLEDLHRDFAKGSQTAFTPEMGELSAALAERGVSLPTGFRSKEQQAALYKGLLERNSDKSPDEIAELIKTGQIEFAAQKKETQTAAGVAGKVEVFANELDEAIPIVQEASAKVPRGEFMPINRLLQTADTSLSDPNLKQLKIYINSVLNAYDALAARGGTDKGKRAENRALLTSADGPEALEAGLVAFRKEAEIAKRAAFKATKAPELSDVGGGNPATVKADAPIKARPGERYSHKGREIVPKDGKWIYKDTGEEVKD